MTKGGVMNKEEIISFVNANPTCYLATVEGDAPHVRAMELCFGAGGTQVRVSGTAEFMDDHNLKKEIVGARPFLKPLVDAHGYDVIKVFRIANAVATVWTRATNLEPREFMKL
jgi:pyridoxamine 5'-phosphate oxidase